MANKHLDDVVACVYRDKGRDLVDARWLLNKAEIPTPSGRKVWHTQEVAEAVLRHDQRVQDQMEEHSGS